MKLYLIAKYTMLALATLLGIAMLAATVVSAIRETPWVLIYCVPILAGWAGFIYLIAKDKF